MTNGKRATYCKRLLPVVSKIVPSKHFLPGFPLPVCFACGKRAWVAGEVCLAPGESCVACERNVLGSRETCLCSREKVPVAAREKRACAREICWRESLAARNRARSCFGPCNRIPGVLGPEQRGGSQFAGASLWPQGTVQGGVLVLATGFFVFLAQNNGGPVNLLVGVLGREGTAQGGGFLALTASCSAAPRCSFSQTMPSNPFPSSFTF